MQGAIIIVGVLQLFDFKEWKYLWKVNRLDWLVWNVVFFVVLFAVRAQAGRSTALAHPCCLKVMLVAAGMELPPGLPACARERGPACHARVRLYLLPCCPVLGHLQARKFKKLS
jgi:hypothetical protein